MKQPNSPEFSRAVAQLTLSDVFFTAMFYHLETVRDDELCYPGTDTPGIACTDGRRFVYRPDTFAKSFPTTAEQVAVVVHELVHVMLYHPLRRGIRHPMVWNLACDFADNALLKQYGFSMVKTRTLAQMMAGGEGWLLDPQFDHMTAEVIYDKLMQALKPKDGDGQGDPGQGTKPGPSGWDVQDYDPNAAGNDDMSAADVERQIGVAAEKAMQAAKAAGKLPAGMRQLLEAAHVKREPWHQHLRRYFTSLHSRQYNWARLDKKRAAVFGICAPDMRTESMGTIVASIDESGSMSNLQRAAIGAHLTHLCRECAPKVMVLIQHDSQVQKVTTIEGPDYDISMERVCCGGTDFRPVFDLIDEQYADAQVVLMFTDLDGPTGDTPPAMDVLWVSPVQRAMSFGEHIDADFND